MAHTRDFRRRAYWEAVRAALGDELRSLESATDLDQVVYHPGRLVLTPPGDALSPNTRVDPALVGAVRSILSSSSFGHYEPTEPVAWTGAQRLLFAVPTSSGDDALSITAQLSPTYPEQLAPVYYTLTQQHAQPGEDPEDGLSALGVPFEKAAPAGGARLGEGIRVAVIDTGISQSAVTTAELPNQEFVDPDDVDPLLDRSDQRFLGPCGGHGTFIASLITSVAPGAIVRSYRVADSMGLATELSIADGIHRALMDGVDVINLSIGGYPFVENSAWPTLPAFTILAAAVNAVPRNVAVVAAAGNCGSSAPFYPAAFPGVFGVAALEASGQLWENSNHGPWVRACTRGVRLRALFVAGSENPAYDPDGRAEVFDHDVNVASWTGTSFAAPLVSAQIAVFAAVMGMQDDTRRAAELLLEMSRTHTDRRGCGRRVLVDLPGQT